MEPFTFSNLTEKKMNKPGYKMIKLFDFPFMLQEKTKNLHLSKEHADVIYPLSSVINPSPPPFFFVCYFSSFVDKRLIKKMGLVKFINWPLNE